MLLKDIEHDLIDWKPYWIFSNLVQTAGKKAHIVFLPIFSTKKGKGLGLKGNHCLFFTMNYLYISLRVEHMCTYLCFLWYKGPNGA
jgi:hypothetical protein